MALAKPQVDAPTKVGINVVATMSQHRLVKLNLRRVFFSQDKRQRRNRHLRHAYYTVHHVTSVFGSGNFDVLCHAMPWPAIGRHLPAPPTLRLPPRRSPTPHPLGNRCSRRTRFARSCFINMVACFVAFCFRASVTACAPHRNGRKKIGF